MNTKFQYELEKYKPGGSTRHTCPQCGRNKCFSRYVDAVSGEPINERCGKCDHESSCGYHYPPSLFFREHPELADKKKVWTVQAPKPDVQPSKPLCTIPASYVERYHSTMSVFCQWLNSLTDDKEHLAEVIDDYRLGATQDGRVVFWQIDKYGHARSGKIMQYLSNGHRTGHPSWVHSFLKSSGLLPEEWYLTQCLFGEHLLLNKSKPVALVECEKSAIVGALFFPQFCWIASGGCKQLNAEKCSCLRGQQVIVFPDSGEYDHWQQVLSSTSGFDYRICHDLERFPRNYDIADKILADMGRQLLSRPITGVFYSPVN